MPRPNISFPTPMPAQSYLTQQLEPSPYLRGPAPRHASGPSRGTPNVLDSIITKLLVTTKQLLQGLEQWSQGVISEEDVSDIYVKLGNGFERCVTAFHQLGISTKDLDSIPQDLRECLEQALAEVPSKETLGVYLPEIQGIIFNLLNGLKQKQAQYKRVLQDRVEGASSSQATTGYSSVQTSPPAALPPGAAPPAATVRPMVVDNSSDSRLSARSAASSASHPGPDRSPSPAPSGLPNVKYPSSSALAGRSTQRSGVPSRPAPPDAFRPPRRTQAETPRRSASPQPIEPPQHVRVQLQDHGPVRSPPPNPPVSLGSAGKPTPPRPDRFSRDSFGNPRPISRFSVDSDITNGSPIKSPVSQTPPRAIPTVTEEPPSVPPSPPPPAESLPPTLPTINMPSSISLQDASAPSPPIEAPPDVPPETRATLAALQRSDVLERRASKRFSSYTFNKMLPSSPGKKPAHAGSSPQRPLRRADRAPPMPALPERLRQESESEGESSTHLTANGEAPGIPGDRAPSPMSDGSSSSVRVVKTPEPEEGGSVSQLPTPRPGDLPPTTGLAPSSIAVFLQIGRQVKKAIVERPITLSALRLLFMERFEYDPGMEDFPDVYIRDNRTGVQFELEDMDDLKEGCVLSLNIEPLDQVKQHFDHTFATLMQEFKEMKSSLDHTRRLPAAPASSLLNVSPPSQTARQIPAAISLPRAESRPSSPHPPVPLDATREADLRAQAVEVQNLRRDLAIMRQIHVDFLQETKENFSKLRSQNVSMKEVVKTKMGGSRAILDNSKAKLEQQCQDTIQAVEEINDIIDAARLDASKRFVTPSRSQMATIQSDLKKATEMVEAFARDVTSVDPTWRATWQLELSRVMEEQKLLSHQTKLAQDLKNDIKDATDMLANVSAFVEQRTTGGARVGSGKGFRPASPDESGGIPNLLMEIRTKESDPTQRLRAIEAQQKAREKEKANKTDEFTSELGDFVKGRKLKKTGGTEEAERMRQRRQEQTLRKMLTGDGNGEVGGGTLTPQTTGTSVMSPLSANLTGSTTTRGSRSPTPHAGSTRGSTGSIDMLALDQDKNKDRG